MLRQPTHVHQHADPIRKSADATIRNRFASESSRFDDAITVSPSGNSRTRTPAARLTTDFFGRGRAAPVAGRAQPARARAPAAAVRIPVAGDERGAPVSEKRRAHTSPGLHGSRSRRQGSNLRGRRRARCAAPGVRVVTGGARAAPVRARRGARCLSAARDGVAPAHAAFKRTGGKVRWSPTAERAGVERRPEAHDPIAVMCPRAPVRRARRASHPSPPHVQSGTPVSPIEDTRTLLERSATPRSRTGRLSRNDRARRLTRPMSRRSLEHPCCVK